MARFSRLTRALSVVALATVLTASATAQQLQIELSPTEVGLDDVMAAVVRLVSPVAHDVTQPVLRSTGFVVQRLAPTDGRPTPEGRQWRFLLVPVETGRTRVEATLDHGGVMLAASGEARVTGAPAVEASASALSDDVTGRRFVTAVVDTPSAYLHQQITYRFRYYFENWLPTGESPQYGLPAFGGFASKPAGQFPADEAARVRVDGKDYFVEEIDVALFPIVTGALTIGETRLVLPRVVDGARDLRTQGLSVTILPLPSPAPADFTGGVGEFAMTVDVADGPAEVGQGVGLALRITGRGDLDTLTGIAPPTSAGGDIYPGATQTDEDLVERLVGGARTFEYVFVPRVAGRATVVFPTMSTFSPAQGTYAAAGPSEITVTVTAARAAADAPPQARRSKFTVVVAGVGAACAVAAALALIAFRRRDEPLSDAGGGEGAASGSDTLAALAAIELGDGRRVCREVDDALRSFLAGELGVARAQVNDALAAATDEGSAAARAALDACAQGRYTPAPLDASAQEDLRRRAALAVKLMAGAA